MNCFNYIVISTDPYWQSKVDMVCCKKKEIRLMSK